MTLNGNEAKVMVDVADPLPPHFDADHPTFGAFIEDAGLLVAVTVFNEDEDISRIREFYDQIQGFERRTSAIEKGT